MIYKNLPPFILDFNKCKEINIFWSDYKLDSEIQ